MATQTPAEENITITQGDTYAYDFVVKEDGSAVDFSAHTNETLQVREHVGGPLLDEYTTSGGTLTTTAGGRVQATFTAAQTKAWPKKAVYEMQSDDGSGNTRTWQTGEITAEREVNEA